MDLSSLSGGGGGGGGGIEAKSSAKTSFGDRYGAYVGDQRFMWVALGVVALAGLLWFATRRH